VSILCQEDINERENLTEALHGLEEARVMGENEECPESHEVA
jgi:hypothetical protein